MRTTKWQSNGDYEASGSRRGSSGEGLLNTEIAKGPYEPTF